MLLDGSKAFLIFASFIYTKATFYTQKLRFIPEDDPTEVAVCCTRSCNILIVNLCNIMRILLLLTT